MIGNLILWESDFEAVWGKIRFLNLPLNCILLLLFPNIDFKIIINNITIMFVFIFMVIMSEERIGAAPELDTNRRQAIFIPEGLALSIAGSKFELYLGLVVAASKYGRAYVFPGQSNFRKSG